MRTSVDESGSMPVECWCCGARQDASQVVRLGNHPEVTLCTRCARSVGKWAGEIEDRDRDSIAARARDRFRAVRKTVIRHGWHHAPLIGRPVRWLGKHLP